MAKDGTWRIEIKPPFTGFVPAYWKNSNPMYGNANQAAAMVDVDMTDPNSIGQGPGLANLTNGTQAAAVTTLIKHIMTVPSTSDATFGIGGNLLYLISSTTVTSGVSDSITWPYTIDKAAVTGEDGESVLRYGGKIYGFYNHSGSAGDILRYDLAGTIIVNWGSLTPTGAAALDNAPHPSIVGGDDVMYFGNGRYVGYYDKDSNTLDTHGLDLDQDGQVVAVAYKDSRVIVAVNTPNLTGNNKCEGKIYWWAGVGVGSWDDQPLVKIDGRIGAILVHGSIVYVWYQKLDALGTNSFHLGFVNGNRVQDIRSFTGSLPLFYQVGTHGNFIMFISGGLVYLYGSDDVSIPMALMQFSAGGYTTVGALSAPFGTPMIASTQSTSYKLAKNSGLSVASYWICRTYDVYRSIIEKVKVDYEATATGSRCDVILLGNKASISKTLAKSGQTGSIVHANDTGKNSKFFEPKTEVEDFSIKLDWTSGSATNNQKIRKITIDGKWLEKT